MYSEEDLRNKYDDDAVFGDIAVQAIMGAVADGVKGMSDEEIGELLKKEVHCIENSLENYILDHLDEMIKDAKGE